MGEKYRLNIPRLNVLSREKLELIHHSTLEVLRRTGVAVKEPVYRYLVRSRSNYKIKP